MDRASHVALDMITHADMWPVQRIDLLSPPVLGRSPHRWLHLLLSVLGLVLIARYLWRWWRTAPMDGPVAAVSPALQWGVIGGLLGLACFAGLRGALQASDALPALSSPVAVAGIVGFCSTLVVGLLIAAAGWHVAAARGLVREAGVRR